MVSYAKSQGAPERVRPVHEAPAPSHRPPPPAPVSNEGEDEDEARFGHAVDPRRVFDVLRRGARPLVAALGVGLLLAVVAYVLMPRKYVATAVLKFGDSADTGTSIEARVRAMSDAVESVHARPVLRAVHRETHLGGVPAALIGQLEVTSDVQSGLIRIAATDRTPGSSARLANATARALLAHLEDSQRVELDAQIRGVDTRLTAETSELARVRDAYDAFRREHGISDLETEREQQITSAAELRSQGDLASSDIGALEARVTQLRRDLARTPRMVAASAATSAPDQQLLMRLEGELVAARSNFSADHPTVRSLEMQVDSLRRRVASGQGAASTQVVMGASGQYQMLESALATAEAELAAARERQTSIQGLAEVARGRVAEFGAIEGEATQLFGAVRTHQTLVEELRDRRARLESRRRSPDVGLDFLTPAARPDTPESSKKKLVVILALPILLLLSVAGALFARDFGKGRLRTPSEIAYWSRVPVIAATDWPRNLRGLDDIVADLDDWSHAAEGLTLIVPISDREIPVVATLAERLDEDWLGSSGLETFVDSARRSGRPGTSATNDAYVRASAAPSPVIVTPPPVNPSATTASVAPGRTTLQGQPPLRGNPTIQGYPAVAASEDESGRFATGAQDDVRDTERPTTALARMQREPSYALRLHDGQRRAVTGWDGSPSGPKLRRAARLADRVVVVVPSGAVHVADLVSLRTRLGRDSGVGIVVVDLPPRFATLPDRVGPVEQFWHASRVEG